MDQPTPQPPRPFATNDEIRQWYLVLDTLERLVKEVTALRERQEEQGADLRRRLDEQNRDVANRFETLRRDELEEMKISIALLMFKVGAWGGGFGIVGGAIAGALVQKLFH